MAIIGGRAHDIKQIHEVGELGFPFAEINLDDPDTVSGQINELKALKEKYGMYFLAHYPKEGNPMDVTLLRKKFIPKMKQLISFSNDLEIQKGTMHFFLDKRWAQPALIEAKTEMLSELADHAVEQKMVLCLENLSSRYDSFLDVFSTVPNLRMTLVMGNCYLLKIPLLALWSTCFTELNISMLMTILAEQV